MHSPGQQLLKHGLIVPEAIMLKALSEENVVDRWLIWIDTVELLTGRNLRRHDADLDAGLNAYMNGEDPVMYARALAYPHAVPTVLLWYTMAAIGIVAIVGIAVWFVRGDL